MYLVSGFPKKLTPLKYDYTPMKGQSGINMYQQNKVVTIYQPQLNNQLTDLK